MTGQEQQRSLHRAIAISVRCAEQLYHKFISTRTDAVLVVPKIDLLKKATQLCPNEKPAAELSMGSLKPIRLDWAMWL